VSQSPNVADLGLEVVSIAADGCLFYPAAGRDVDEAVSFFAPTVREFRFCDTRYGQSFLPVPEGWAVQAESISGDPGAMMSEREADGRQYRHIEPCHWIREIRDIAGGNPVTMTLRRGFGQYALQELGDGSISVFMHRGDSPGEGGSDAWFLARRKRRHAPLSFLFDKLARKLRDRALIVSDGSNSDITPRRCIHPAKGPVEGATAALEMQDVTFDKWGFSWRCIGHLSPRYGPTLIWKVERVES
jgi:hypothetical protein